MRTEEKILKEFWRLLEERATPTFVFVNKTDFWTRF